MSSAPAIEPVLKVLLQEDGNAVSEASKSIKNATQKVIHVKDTVFGYFGNEKAKPAPAAPTSTSKSNFPPLHRRSHELITEMTLK